MIKTHTVSHFNDIKRLTMENVQHETKGIEIFFRVSKNFILLSIIVF